MTEHASRSSFWNAIIVRPFPDFGIPLIQKTFRIPLKMKSSSGLADSLLWLFMFSRLLIIVAEMQRLRMNISLNIPAKVSPGKRFGRSALLWARNKDLYRSFRAKHKCYDPTAVSGHFKPLMFSTTGITKKIIRIQYIQSIGKNFMIGYLVKEEVRS